MKYIKSLLIFNTILFLPLFLIDSIYATALDKAQTSKSGIVDMFEVLPEYLQVDSTAENRDFHIKRNERAIGSGTQYYFYFEGGTLTVSMTTDGIFRIGNSIIGTSTSGNASYPINLAGGTETTGVLPESQGGFGTSTPKYVRQNNGSSTTQLATNITLAGTGTDTATMRTNGVDISPTEKSYLDGSTSNIQTQIDTIGTSTPAVNSIVRTETGTTTIGSGWIPNTIILNNLTQITTRNYDDVAGTSTIKPTQIAIGTTTLQGALNAVGSATFLGTVTASGFSGNGSQLTGISATVAFSEVTGSASASQLPLISGLLGSATSAQLPPISGLLGSATSAQLPPISGLLGSATSAQLPPISGLSGSATSAQLPPIYNYYIFGNGTQSLTIAASTTTTLNGINSYTNVTIEANGTLTCSANRPLVLYVNGTLTVNGAINLNGLGGVGGASGAGGVPSRNPGTNGTNSSSFHSFVGAGAGGNGSRESFATSGVGGIGGNYASTVNKDNISLATTTYNVFYTDRYPQLNTINYVEIGLGGGGGGGGGASAEEAGGAGGVGGAGGGSLHIYAKYIVNNGIISARGANGNNGSNGTGDSGGGGGGGGGSGGRIFMITGAYSGAGSYSVLYGSGGVKGSGGNNDSSNGSNGATGITFLKILN